MINFKHSIRKFVGFELLFCGVFIVIAGCYAGWTGMQSASLAGLTYFIPNAYRTFRIFRYQGARAARQILKGFHQGMMVKFGLSIVMFAGVFLMGHVQPIIFLGTYIGLQMLIGFAPLLMKEI